MAGFKINNKLAKRNEYNLVANYLKSCGANSKSDFSNNDISSRTALYYLDTNRDGKINMKDFAKQNSKGNLLPYSDFDKVMCTLKKYGIDAKCQSQPSSKPIIISIPPFIKTRPSSKPVRTNIPLFTDLETAQKIAADEYRKKTTGFVVTFFKACAGEKIETDTFLHKIRSASEFGLNDSDKSELIEYIANMIRPNVKKILPDLPNKYLFREYWIRSTLVYTNPMGEVYSSSKCNALRIGEIDRRVLAQPHVMGRIIDSQRFFEGSKIVIVERHRPNTIVYLIIKDGKQHRASLKNPVGEARLDYNLAVKLGQIKPITPEIIIGNKKYYFPDEIIQFILYKAEGAHLSVPKLTNKSFGSVLDIEWHRLLNKGMPSTRPRPTTLPKN